MRIEDSESFRAVMANPHPQTEKVDVEGILARVHDGGVAVVPHKMRSRRTWVRYTGIAASVLVIAVAIQLGRPTICFRKSDTTNYLTQAGQRARIALSSGDTILLAPATKIKVSKNIIDLEGEAIFSITHTSDKPFIVRTRISTTRVLGTSFGVRAYAEDKAVRVTVESGRVMLDGAGVLGAGDVGRVTSTGKSTVVHGTNVASLLEWRVDVLSFNGEHMRDVIPELQRWYNIPIVVANPAINDLKITATLRSRSIENLAAVLQGALEVKAIWDGKTLTLK